MMDTKFEKLCRDIAAGEDSALDARIDLVGGWDSLDQAEFNDVRDEQHRANMGCSRYEAGRFIRAALETLADTGCCPLPGDVLGALATIAGCKD